MTEKEDETEELQRGVDTQRCFQIYRARGEVRSGAFRYTEKEERFEVVLSDIQRKRRGT